jgi:hypothetical protein
MSPYTALVAVDEQTVQRDGQLVTIQVPVEVPAGVSAATTIGDDSDDPVSRTFGAALGSAPGSEGDVEELGWESINIAVRHPWELELSTSLGIGDGLDGNAALAGLSFSATRDLGAHLALGLDAGLILPSFDPSLGLSRLLADLSWRLTRSGLRIHAAAGPALSFDGRPGLAAAAALSLPLPVRWHYGLSTELRTDYLDVRDGDPDQLPSSTSVSLRLGLTW